MARMINKILTPASLPPVLCTGCELESKVKFSFPMLLSGVAGEGLF